jgi:hypothetical protein
MIRHPETDLTNPRIETCFVSAPVDAKLDTIRAVLAKNGVRVLGLQDARLGQMPSASKMSIAACHSARLLAIRAQGIA